MPAMRPTPEQVRYLQHFAAAEAEFNLTGWTQNPLAVWRATHPEGTNLTEKQLLGRIKKQFTAMKAQGWVTDTRVEHHYADDAVNTRTFEETLYRITERGKRALVEAGAAPVITRRKSPEKFETPSGSGTEETMEETIVLVDGPADGRVVTLPAGRHDQVLFAWKGTDVRYRRSRRPAVDGHTVFVPVDGADALVGAR